MATGRPRGFIEDWNPRPHVANLVSFVQDILEVERDYLPLTLRQIFYRIVSQYIGEQHNGFEFGKTEKHYKRLCESMNKARRAMWVSMDDIRDDGLTQRSNAGWDTKHQFLNYCRGQGDYFTLDRQSDQERKIFIWCEAAGMVPQLIKAVQDYHIPVLSSGGFDSVTTKHNFAQQMAEHDDALVLHLGDHDPSGVHMFGSLDEDVQRFWEHYGGGYGKRLEFRRLAVTPDQVMEMRLPTAPPKSSDNRSFEGLTTQCEAIPPGELNKIAREAVEAEIDFDVLNATKNKELEIRADLKKRFAKIMD